VAAALAARQSKPRLPWIRRSMQHRPDYVHHHVRIAENLMVPEAKDAYASIFQPLRALCIPSLATRLVMLSSVYFNSEFGGGAIEVQHETLNGMLLAEAEAIQLPPSEARPK